MDETVKKSPGTNAIKNNNQLDALYQNISQHIHAARQEVLRTVNTEMVKAYWLIGIS